MGHRRLGGAFLRRASSQTFLQRFEAKAALHWTANRVQALTAGKDYPLAPNKPGVPALLRVLGFLDAEAQLAPNALRSGTIDRRAGSSTSIVLRVVHHFPLFSIGACGMR